MGVSYGFPSLTVLFIKLPQKPLSLSPLAHQHRPKCSKFRFFSLFWGCFHPHPPPFISSKMLHILPIFPNEVTLVPSFPQKGQQLKENCIKRWTGPNMTIWSVLTRRRKTSFAYLFAPLIKVIIRPLSCPVVVEPQLAVKHHAAAHSFPQPVGWWRQGGGGEGEAEGAVKLMRWNKDSLIGQEGKITMIIEYAKQAMRNTIAHHLLTYAQPVSEPWCSPANCPRLYTGHDIIWYRISLWLIRVTCPCCIPSQLVIYSQPRLAEQ